MNVLERTKERTSPFKERNRNRAYKRTKSSGPKNVIELTKELSRVDLKKHNRAHKELNLIYIY